MTDSVQLFPAGWRFTDQNGDIVSGGTLSFFAAGTTTPLTVYADAGLATALGVTVYVDSSGYPVTSLGSSTRTLVYTGTDPFKIVGQDANGVVLFTHDNVKGAVVSGGGSGSGLWELPVDHGATSVALTVADLGRCKDLDDSVGALTAVLPSAIDAYNNQVNTIVVRKVGTSNSVTVVPSGGQTINGSGSVNLTSQWDSITLASNGANWNIVAFVRGGLAAGAITSDLLDARVVGGLAQVGDIKVVAHETPPAGWLECDGSAKSRTTYAALFAAIGTRHGQGDGVSTFNLPDYRGRFWRFWDHGAGRDSDAAARTAMATGGATGDHVGSLQSDQIRAHTHNVPHSQGSGVASGGGGSNWVYNGNAEATSSTGGSETRPLNAAVMAIILADPAAAAGAASAIATILNGHGAPSNVIGVNGDFYYDVDNVRWYGPKASSAWGGYVSLIGPQGTQGPSGVQGAVGPGYAATSTSSVAIGTGSKTWTTQAGLAYTAGARARVAYDASNYLEGPITSYAGTTLVINVDRVAGSGTYAAWNIGLAGDVGATGATGASGAVGATGATGPSGANGTDPGLRWLFASSTTMADPSAGNIRLNNATLASVTAAAVSYNCGESGNPSVANFVKSWDDSSTAAHRGYLIVKKAAAPQNYVVFDITGALTDNSTWAQLALTVVDSSGSFSAADPLSVQFERTGDAGAGVGDMLKANNLSDLASPKTGFDTISVHGTDVASASTVNLDTATGVLVDVTGTTAITAITLSDGRERVVRFTGILTLTNGASLVLPGGANITTAAGDFAVFRGYAAGVVRCVLYTRANGKALVTAVASSDISAATLAALSFGPFTSIASAATTDLSTVGTIGVSITGTTTITSLGTGANLYRLVKFAGALTLTHNATSLILNGSNITTAAGATAGFLSDGSGNWTCLWYQPPGGNAAAGANADITSLSALASVNGGALAGYRNRLINGGMRINQRLAQWAHGLTSADDAYALDRWNLLAEDGDVAATVTFTNGSPNIGWTAHNRVVGDSFRLTTTGTLPTNFATGTQYYVLSVVDANTITVAQYTAATITLPAPTAISAGSAGSGTHTATGPSLTPSQITAVENGTPYAMRIKQNQATAARFGCAQIVESADCIDMRGATVTLSARVRMSASTTLRYAILEWTGTADVVTSDVVNNWASGTFTAGNFFLASNLTVTATGSLAITANTLASISLSATISSSANNIIVLLWTDSAQAQNVTLDISNVQLEIGVATSFERRPAALELGMCARYFSFNPPALGMIGASTTVPTVSFPWAFPMRSAPTIALVLGLSAWTELGVALRDVSALNNPSNTPFGCKTDFTTATAGTSYRPGCMEGRTFSANAEL